jgi:hypothetical protein
VIVDGAKCCGALSARATSRATRDFSAGARLSASAAADRARRNPAEIHHFMVRLPYRYQLRACALRCARA